jgi:hypothetical protein
LIMGEPLNRAMLLGDEATPDAAELRRHAGGQRARVSRVIRSVSM